MMEDDSLAQLQRLKLAAPEATLLRLNRRLRVVHLGRDLVERQAWAFWIVLDAFLRLFLKRLRLTTNHRPPVRQRNEYGPARS